LNNVPCKDCEDRTARCHASCEEYLAYRTERDEMISKKYKNLQTRDASYEMRFKRTRKRAMR